MKGEEERLQRTIKAGEKRGDKWENQQIKGRDEGKIQVQGQKRYKEEEKVKIKLKQREAVILRPSY